MMLRYFTLIMFFGIVLLDLLSCCRSKQFPSSEIEYMGKGGVQSGSVESGVTKWENGTIWLIATGYSKDKREAELNAEINAFETLLFQGVPGSPQKSPMILNKAQALKDYNYFFSKLLKSEGFRTHVLERENMNKIQALNWCRGKKIYKSKTRVKINLYSLRRAMEQAGVIKKFGL